MSEIFYNRINSNLSELESSDNLRLLPHITHDGLSVWENNFRMLNLSSNDYLGVAADADLKKEFFEKYSINELQFSSSSSRLLTGNYLEFEEIENTLSSMYGSESALVFNCGYMANIGILPAICTKNTLILADKLVHASIIDGIRLASASFVRYNHNNYDQLERLVSENASKYETIIIVTESIFSMDGDLADIKRILKIKKQYSNILLYLDEAHAVGVRGEFGLGLAEELNCLSEIDFLIGTFGKSFASSGAYVVCRKEIRAFLINKMRSFIFSTAMPALNVKWTNFILNKNKLWSQKRSNLKRISSYFSNAIKDKGYICNSESHIIPVILGSSSNACRFAEKMKENGFYVLPIRKPTVPENTARLRFSLNAELHENQLQKIISLIPNAL
jgi:8-amino-7-oxononanoate synthase